MAFKLKQWGAEIANAKSITEGGVNYYRYEIPANDTITTAGYFPKDLGLKLGDRIWVIPNTKTDTDLLYVVSNISSYGVITVSLAAGQGDTLPAQTGNAGKYLTTDGSNASWADVGGLPEQTGNSGKFLTTNGSVASWVSIIDDTSTSSLTTTWSASKLNSTLGDIETLLAAI